MTKVINILAGSGCGKTTTAAGVFYELKKRNINCELVSEYVKTWAWQGRKIEPIDQGYILERQARSERLLYGKVDYIVTDSPFMLSPIYEKFYNDTEYTKNTVFYFLEEAKKQGVEHINFLLNRTKPFNPQGRYEDEETAKKIDVAVVEFLLYNRLGYYKVSSEDQDDKVAEILYNIGEEL